MYRREFEPVGHLLEARHLAIGWEQRLYFQPRQGEQILERVLKFCAGHPPHPDAAVASNQGGVGRGEFVAEPLRDGCQLRLVGPLLSRGRHLAGDDPVVDVGENFERCRIREVPRQRLEIELRLGVGP